MYVPINFGTQMSYGNDKTNNSHIRGMIIFHNMYSQCWRYPMWKLSSNTGSGEDHIWLPGFVVGGVAGCQICRDPILEVVIEFQGLGLAESRHNDGIRACFQVKPSRKTKVY